MKKLRARVWEVMSPAAFGDLGSRVVDIVIVGLVLLDMLCFILDSIPDPSGTRPTGFSHIEGAVLVLFTIDYFLRIWSCRSDDRYAAPLRGRIRYAVTPLAIIDLISILPALAYVPFVGEFLHIEPHFALVRVFRVFRIGKLARYSTSLHTLGRALRRVRTEFGVLLIVTGIIVLLSSTLAYVFEEQSNDKFSSIPAAMWWAIVTMTTVGYGDVAPVTTMGRVVATFLMICGIGMFALPAGLLGAAFTEEVGEQRRHLQKLREARLQRAEELRDELRHEHGEEDSIVCPHCDRAFVPAKSE